MASTVTLPYDINNGDALDADEVMDNLDEIVSAYNAAIGALSGSVVGTSDSQTLTNKTLTSPVITGAAGATPTTAGQMQYDSTANKLKYGDGTNTITLGSANRAFSWYLDGTQIAANELGARFIAPKAMTVTEIRFVCTSGTATARIQKGTSDIASGMSISSTQGSKTTSFTSTSIAKGDVITLDLTACSSGKNIIVVMECEA